MLGQPFMPWQRFVADVGGEYDPATGLPFYREIIVTMPRQQGKTILFLSWQVNRCVSSRWQHPQRSAFTAHAGSVARRKWLNELFPMIRASPIRKLVAVKQGRLQVNEGMGNESVRFHTGSLIELLSTSQGAGHSESLHQAVLDEVWHDYDWRREQGLRPTMITVPDRQLLVCSTAGTQASTVLNAKVATGRQAVLADRGRGVAYFECSAPDDWDPNDDGSYFEFMPALCPAPPCRCDPAGRWRHTVTLDAIQEERDAFALRPAEFRRAYGNLATPGADMVIPQPVWERVCHPDGTGAARPEGQVRFGLDVDLHRSSAAVCASDGKTIELVKHKPDQGLEWVVGYCNELTGRHRGSKVAVDFGGPAGVLADSLDACERLKGPEVVVACGDMYDAIVEARVVFRWDQAFDDAVAGAVKKPVGDRFVWSRKASTADVTPLMAATLAHAPAEPPQRPRIVVAGG